MGVEEIVAVHKEAGDDYSYIMVEAIADRLAEAFAEKLHELVRRDIWGYAADESLNVDEMLKVKYQVKCGKSMQANHCTLKRKSFVLCVPCESRL